MTVAPGSPPAVCANVSGPLEIWVGTGAASALEFLGYSVNGVTIEEIPLLGEVKSDEYGGEQGPPSDYQLFGFQHRVSMELSKFQDAVLAKLTAGYNPAATPGVGMLLGCLPATTRLLLFGLNFTRNYPAMLLLEPVERSPIGSQYTRARLNLTCNAKAGVVPWNTVTA